ncbi:MAG: glycosyltransferase family 9 protein [archaeon]|jgi:hypothetical protein
MYWTWKINGETYVSWGEPRNIENLKITDLKPDYSVKIYSGQEIQSHESVLFMMQGDATLGMGDSIWLISFMRDIYRIKGRRRCKFAFASSKVIQEFYSHFLPKTIEFLPDFITKKQFDSFTYHLPAMYYWKDESIADKSWVDNKSILQRLYDWTGMKYEGLPDFGEFTDENVLYPKEEFYKKLEINKNDKYVFFQWHSSGHAKNLPPKSNIKLIRHIINKYKLKVYVIGRLDSLKALEKIPGVVNLANKTTGFDVFSLAFNAEFLVSPDSAGVHLGEAYKIPAVGILATLPPVYICSKYKIPTFMFGSGECRYKPCGVVTHLPKDTRCPSNTGNYCKVLEEINLNLFDKCVTKTFEKRREYKSRKPLNFYNAQEEPLVLE